MVDVVISLRVQPVIMIHLKFISINDILDHILLRLVRYISCYVIKLLHNPSSSHLLINQLLFDQKVSLFNCSLIDR